MDTKRIWARRAISAFLLFHLFGVIVTPNPASFLNQAVSAVYRPYMNSLGLAHTWGFFAPEPVAPPVYLDYTLEMKEGMSISGRFPDEKDPYFFRDRYNRLMSMSRFVGATNDNLRNMFVHYLCRQHPLMASARLWRVVGSQATLEMVKSGQKKITDPVDFKIEVLGTYFCGEDR